MGAVTINGHTIELFSFDLWETLISEAEEPLRQKERARIIAEKSGAAPNAVHAAIRKVSRAFTEVYYREGRTMLTLERLDLILERLGRTLSPAEREETAQLLSEASLVIAPPLIDGAAAFLELLKKNGVTVTLISDTGYSRGCEMRTLLDRHGMLHFFDLCLFSDEEGMAKPRRELFEKIERTFPRIPPSRMLHMGDNPLTDIAGAERSGWRTMLFQRNDEVRRVHYSDRRDLPRVGSYAELTALIGR
jgi:putative hydrolase of the HAD superfamily